MFKLIILVMLLGGPNEGLQAVIEFPTTFASKETCMVSGNIIAGTLAEKIAKQNKTEVYQTRWGCNTVEKVREFIEKHVKPVGKEKHLDVE